MKDGREAKRTEDPGDAVLGDAMELGRLFALIDEAIIVVQDGAIRVANEAAARFAGLDGVADLVGRPVLDFVPPSEEGRVADDVARIDVGEAVDRWDLEWFQPVEGDPRQLHMRVTPTTLDGAPAVFVVLHPLEASPESVDQRVASLQAVNNERFASVSLKLAGARVDSLDETIEEVLADIAVPNDVDRAYVLLFNDELGEMDCTHEWTAPGIEPQISYVSALKTDSFPWSFEILNRHERLYVQDLSSLPPAAAPEQASFALYDVQSLLLVPMIADGQLRGAVGFNSIRRSVHWHESVIDQVVAVASAMATNLLQREATTATRRARDEAEQASREKDEFLSRMGHELRTPLNAVLGFTELLLLDERSDEDRHLLSQVHSSGRTLLNMVEDVLDMTRIRTGEIDVEIGNVSPDEAVAEAIERTRAAAGQHGVDLVVASDREAGNRTLRADYGLLVRVLRALLSNGVRFNSAGGSVTVMHSRRPNSVGLEEHVIEVIDTGIGMNAAQLAGAFEPFDRGADAPADGRGSGTGLSLSRLLTREMGGTLELTSSPGAGTTATLAFPVA